MVGLDAGLIMENLPLGSALAMRYVDRRHWHCESGLLVKGSGHGVK